MFKTERWTEEVRNAGSEPQQRFVMSYRQVITRIAYQVASGLPPTVELNDLIGDGTIGLIEAIGSFDPSREVQFSSYAEKRIRGAILDGLRSLDWVPRSLRRDLRRLERTRQELQQKHRRCVTSEEVAGDMELSLDDLHRLLAVTAPSLPQAGRLSTLPSQMGDAPAPDDLPDPSGFDPQMQFIQQEACRLLRQAIGRLPERERVVISSYHFDDLSLKEIGRRLGLSESRICQIHGRAMARVRRLLARLMSHPTASRPGQDNGRLQEAS